MEIQFEQKPVRFLCRTAWGEKTVEETAEIKLPGQELSPEQILGAWGQPCLTEKHWSDGSVSVSGGVNAWVLLQDAEGVQCVAGWIPFKQSWDLHDSQRDGKVVVRSSLRSVDARMTGAGKLIITAQVSLYLQALEPCAVNRYLPPQLPEDVHVQKKNITVTVPMEAGEKRVSMDEELGTAQSVSALLYHRTQPRAAECRVMGDKLVFRGEVTVDALCRGEDGEIFMAHAEYPVSQYIQLDSEYGSRANADVIPVVLSAEVDKNEEGKLSFHGNVLWQYILHDEVELEGVADAYSNRRKVEMDMTQLCIPALVGKDSKQECSCELSAAYETVIDQTVMAVCAEWDERTGKLQQEGAVRVLCRNEEGQLQSALLPFEAELTFAQDGDGYAVAADQKPAEAVAEQGQLRVRIPYSMYSMEDVCLPCCKGIVIEDAVGQKERRPCYILRRAGKESLWQIAKTCGSTEEAIRTANGFDGEAEQGRMLLIPVE